MEDHARQIAAASPAETLIELGSGSSTKTPLLLDALGNAGPLRGYLAVDVNDSALTDAHAELFRRYPDMRLRAMVADFESSLHLLPRDGRQMVAFLGGTVGNLQPGAHARFFTRVRDLLGTGSGTLPVGTALVQPAEVPVPAYDDAAGGTGKFNRNALHVLNAELGADFEVEAFEHVVVWNEEQERIEMRLRSTRPMHVRLPAPAPAISFDEGEELRAESSAKSSPADVTAELDTPQLAVLGQWRDPLDRFALTLAEPR